MNIVLPDGSNKELAKGATVADVALPRPRSPAS